tara:strand:+ start:4495 stop:5268 length:774 start_codon:yes stop_codon:yes gene_type:complete
MKKFALVDIKGGLGNQIFILAFAYHLKNNNFIVRLDTNFYKYEKQFPRELEIKIKNTGLKRFNFRNNKIFFLLNTWYEDIENLDNCNFKLVNRFTGYYQNIDFLNESKDKIINVLGINVKPKIKNSCLIHIRKGDYKQLNEELKMSYYESAITQLLHKYPDTLFDIFTDDQELILDNNIFSNINSIYYPENKENSTEVLEKMTRYQHYIIANSSFSLIAASFGSDKHSEVFYPSPWWKNFDVTVKNIPSSWRKVENF